MLAATFASLIGWILGCLLLGFVLYMVGTRSLSELHIWWARQTGRGPGEWDDMMFFKPRFYFERIEAGRASTESEIGQVASPASLPHPIRTNAELVGELIRIHKSHGSSVIDVLRIAATCWILKGEDRPVSSTRPATK